MRNAAALDKAVRALTDGAGGLGGAVAVLDHGETIVRHSWGYANAERRIPFAPTTLFRICSITKQFTCALLLDTIGHPTELDGDIPSLLPNLRQAPPQTLHLCHNQSGLRDYWAVAMLQGASIDGVFGPAEAERQFRATRTLQFEPGTRYSYANQNFTLLGQMIEHRANRDFASLLAERIFEKVGMATAFVAADTRAMPDGTEGYEGSAVTGYIPAINRIRWVADAGLGASLDDMIAWERFIDGTNDQPDSLYKRLSGPVQFRNGSRAAYGFGLSHGTAFGRTYTGHGGALRGWRSFRMYVPSERISVVVLFNHMGNARAAALDLFAALVDGREADFRTAAPALIGDYIEPETKLLTRIADKGNGTISIQFDEDADMLFGAADGSASGGEVALRPTSEGLRMDRPREGQSSIISPLGGVAKRDIAGRYRCEEFDATLLVADAGGRFYGAFSGPFGDGRMEAMTAIGSDVWTLACPRALDQPPPGDWTIIFDRGSDDRPRGMTLGCQIARQLWFERLS
ncbi:D-aminopeptidase (plasmid) [Sphingobium sp. SJ10-10]|uniref:D-aminopeptidase n=1 Tax=Sphingobium sp. SJ10-10 TaxID=3114999 RepID=UPI002E1962FB|nr:D-aminopeptidase [Sphingobium sp. SJ10-10]